jgi:hypothetical protein
MIFRSSSTDPSHLNLGFPTRRVPPGLSRVSILQGSSFCILQSCPIYLSLPIFITITTSVIVTALKLSVIYQWCFSMKLHNVLHFLNRFSRTPQINPTAKKCLFNEVELEYRKCNSQNSTRLQTNTRHYNCGDF